MRGSEDKYYGAHWMHIVRMPTHAPFVWWMPIVRLFTLLWKDEENVKDNYGQSGGDYKYLLEGQYYNDIRLPAALCGTCRRVVQDYPNETLRKQLISFSTVLQLEYVAPRPTTRSCVVCPSKIGLYVPQSTLHQESQKGQFADPLSSSCASASSTPRTICACSYCPTVVRPAGGSPLSVAVSPSDQQSNFATSISYSICYEK